MHLTGCVSLNSTPANLAFEREHYELCFKKNSETYGSQHKV